MNNVVNFETQCTSANQASETYRNYSLVCTQDKEICIGEVFKENVRVAYCESLDIEAAQQHLRRIVDWHIKDAIKLRDNATPDFELWCTATTQVLFQASSAEKSILKKLASADNNYVKVSELAKAGKLSCTSSVNYILSDFTRRVCDLIPYDPPYPGDGRDPYLSILCENSIANDSVRLTSVFSTILKNYHA